MWLLGRRRWDRGPSDTDRFTRAEVIEMAERRRAHEQRNAFDALEAGRLREDKHRIDALAFAGDLSVAELLLAEAVEHLGDFANDPESGEGVDRSFRERVERLLPGALERGRTAR